MRFIMNIELIGKIEERRQSESLSPYQQEPSPPDPKRRNCEIIVGTLVFLGYVVSLLLFCLFFIAQLYTSSPSLDFKWICVSRFPLDQYCFISVGQYAVGLICIGQMAAGLVTVSQIGSGLLVGIGQFQITLGVAIAQLAVGTFIPMTQLGFAAFKVIYAQCGFQLDLFNKNRKQLYVSCCKRR